MTEPTITLDVSRSGSIDRKTVLSALADGVYIEPVFGPDRPIVADAIISCVRSVMPTQHEVIEHAWGYGNARRISAYRNGREYILGAYHGYAREEDFPYLGSPDLPKGE